jgi:hypothetical protein
MISKDIIVFRTFLKNLLLYKFSLFHFLVRLTTYIYSHYFLSKF